jgi:hypothetical protein
VLALDISLLPLAHILELLLLDEIKLKSFVIIKVIKESLGLLDVHCCVLLHHLLILVNDDPWLLVGLGLLVG